ncbi:FAD-dependent monooxygenase [Akkermansiaceae bacterium]|nr:FAD-dependent monooxygenase [Akkermansiaceae bacterium]MDB4452262.1 FAD-dependent monooxygenase [Akkermansiaceae bacterium]
MKRIEIAGGGLAGLSLGIALRKRGVPVLVREAGSYPRHKVCGEFINGVTLETLENLGIAGIFQKALRHSRTRWWVGDREVLDAEMARPALGMSRWEMDVALRDLFLAEGGELQVKDRVTREAGAGLVWTAGRRLEKGSDWLGLKGHFEKVPLKGGLEMHIGDGGYVGLTPITEDGGRVNVCGLFKRRNLRGENLTVSYLRACGLSELADRLEEGELDEASVTGVSGFQLGAQRVEDGLCSLGDAERMIPPFTGNGMSMAFESAECALDQLVQYAGGGEWNDCRSEIHDALERRFKKRVTFALGLHRFLTTRAGRGGLSLAARSGLLPFHWLHRQLS